MIRIQLNERTLDVEEGTTVLRLRDRRVPDADVAIVNGFPAVEDKVLRDGDTVALFTRGRAPTEEELESLLVARHTPGVHAAVKAARVGIAGLGGLGSHVAVALARTGIGCLVLVDHDVVEPSNLNRQQYWVEQIGQPKVLAMETLLRSVHPYTRVVPHRVTITAENAGELFEGCDVVAECLDAAEAKAMLVRTLLGPTRIVAASGLAGHGPANLVRTRKRIEGLWVVGDEESEARPGLGLMAPRVGVAAHHQANAVLRLLLGSDPCRD